MIKRIKLDMCIYENIGIPIKQYDDVIIQVTITDHYRKVNLEGYVAMVFMQDFNGDIYSQECKIEESTVVFSTGNNITNNLGKVKIEIRFIKELNMVTTFPFYLNILKDIR